MRQNDCYTKRHTYIQDSHSLQKLAASIFMGEGEWKKKKKKKRDSSAGGFLLIACNQPPATIPSLPFSFGSIKARPPSLFQVCFSPHKHLLKAIPFCPPSDAHPTALHLRCSPPPIDTGCFLDKIMYGGALTMFFIMLSGPV